MKYSERCPECGSWEAECVFETPQKDCRCVRCASHRIEELEKQLIYEQDRNANNVAISAEELKKLQTDNEELNYLFDLQWRRINESDTEWRKENPGNDLVRPDLGQIIEWYCKKIENLRTENTKLHEAIELLLRVWEGSIIAPTWQLNRWIDEAKEKIKEFKNG